MSFTALTFLTLFLPSVCAAYFLLPPLRTGVLLLASLCFCAWGAPAFLPAVLVLSNVDYHLAHRIAREPRAGVKKALLVFGVSMHLAVLGYFKYANFFVAQTNRLLEQLSLAPMPWSTVLLPMGVSFLAFEAISYLVDVYRGRAQPAQNVFQYLLFLLLFPHCVAGPILRWRDIEPQFAKKSIRLDQVAYGIRRFCIGLARAALIGHVMGTAVDPIFSRDPTELTAAIAWLGIACYALQIYFDFSGYSDMAIGLGHILGFSFKENFNDPYLSGSIIEFWRRWHISLSSWLRDYLYQPLGGNRGSPLGVSANLLVVFLLSGLWHGANWTFVVWGLYHGALALAERTQLARALRGRLPRALNVASTLFLVLIGWVFFRSPSVGHAIEYIGALFGCSEPNPLVMMPPQALANRVLAMAALGSELVLLPLWRGVRPIGQENLGRQPVFASAWQAAWSGAAALCCLGLAFAYLCNSKYSPHIYFQF